MKKNIYLWTPLIGFDKNLEACGAHEYLDKLGFVPDAVSLFVFNPDIVNLHEAGMKAEKMLPLSNSNYFGSTRNEIREIQQWSNFELRALCLELKAHGVKPLMGIMGVDRGKPDPDQKSLLSHVEIHQEYLKEHPELFRSDAEYGVQSLNVLKRFSDGSFYEDYLARKLKETLCDYEMDGVHLGDAIMPQSAKVLDYSDDMISQFVEHTGISLPDVIAQSTDSYDKAGMKKRRVYVWNMHRLAWLSFTAWRWERFMKKVCDVLHTEGKEVVANSSWCTDSFEAYYRYGVDYKALHRAGLDFLLLEDQASSVYIGDDSDRRYNMQKYNLMPLMVRAFSPNGGVLGFNAVKDSTEEWSVISHKPSALEREIYSLPNTFLQSADGLKRSLDGFLVCLADGLNKDEWTWLRERYDLSFDEEPAEVLTPLMAFSDSHIYDFMPDYIETRRWSHYKQLYEFAKKGAQIAGVFRIEEIEHVSGPIFVPNIDVLPIREQQVIARYDRGPVICTSLACRQFVMPNEMMPDFYVEDPVAAFKMCIAAYHIDYIDTEIILKELGKDDEAPDIAGSPKFTDEPSHYTHEMIYRKVSSGFVTACARLIRQLNNTPIETGIDEQLVVMLMKDRRYRLFLANNNVMQYSKPKLFSKRRILNIKTYSKFPALPPKLITSNNSIVDQRNKNAFAEMEIIGFIHKIPPFGASIVDVWLDE